VGTQSYAPSTTKPKSLKIYNSNETKFRETTEAEYAKYEKERDEIFIKKMGQVEKSGVVWLNKSGQITTSKEEKRKIKALRDLDADEYKELTSKVKADAGREAKKKIKY
jgi:hypothetical protein